MNNVRLVQVVFAFLFLFVSSQVISAQSPPDIRINNYLRSDKVQKGSSVQGVVEMEIPQGFHVHSNRPLEKFLIATQLTVEAPNGIRVGRVSYPRAVVKNLKFSKNKVAVFEGKATMRFNVAVPANYSGDSLDFRGKLRYQSCNDEVCFRPETREFNFSVRLVK